MSKKQILQKVTIAGVFSMMICLKAFSPNQNIAIELISDIMMVLALFGFSEIILSTLLPWTVYLNSKTFDQIKSNYPFHDEDDYTELLMKEV
jgi:hypothetical protein